MPDEKEGEQPENDTSEEVEEKVEADTHEDEEKDDELTAEVQALIVPPYLKEFTDANFQNKVIRVTDPGKPVPGIPNLSWDPKVAIHHYSIDQAWNADQSLIILDRGTKPRVFLDGTSYQPKFALQKPGNCRWHPDDPKLMIFASSKGVGYWDVTNNSQKIVDPLNGYNDEEIESKGNTSTDGRMVTLLATRRSDGHKVIFAYNLETKKKHPDIDVNHWADKNWITMSPLGKYIICYPRVAASDANNKRIIYTLEGKQVGIWPEYERPGHGDFMVLGDREVMIGRTKVEPDKQCMIVRNLSDGKVTKIGDRCLAQHTTARNTGQGLHVVPHWAFATFTESKVPNGGMPCRNEVAAFSTDGKQTIKHLATHNSLQYDYYSEPHGSPSRDGKRVIFASNWGKAGGPVAAYVASFD